MAFYLEWLQLHVHWNSPTHAGPALAEGLCYLLCCTRFEHYDDDDDDDDDDDEGLHQIVRRTKF